MYYSSAGRITRAMAEETLAATRDEPVPLLDSFFVMATGGSSGERGVFVFDGEAVVQYFSALMRWRARQVPPGARVRSPRESTSVDERGR